MGPVMQGLPNLSTNDLYSILQQAHAPHSLPNQLQNQELLANQPSQVIGQDPRPPPPLPSLGNMLQELGIKQIASPPAGGHSQPDGGHSQPDRSAGGLQPSGAMSPTQEPVGNGGGSALDVPQLAGEEDDLPPQQSNVAPQMLAISRQLGS